MNGSCKLRLCNEKMKLLLQAQRQFSALTTKECRAMRKLNGFNIFYRKYLYIIIPLITLMIAIIEVSYEINNGDMMHILANICMGFISLSFWGFYLMSDKQRTDYCLIELYLFFYIVFLALDNHIHFNDIVWLVFLPCAIICAILIIIFHKKYK